MTLHTKYRPKSFKTFLGNESVIKSLQGNLAKRRSQCFLFHSKMAGVGKTTLARLGAKAIGDSNPTEIDGATYNGVDDMRTITATLEYKPLEGEAKAIIIDECHRLSPQAWDSILKATEEPPDHVFWFFASTLISKVPATIVSRCAKYELKEVPTEILINLVETVAGKESIEISFPVITLCAKQAKGSPRQALVNLGVCAEAEHVKEAMFLLEEAEGKEGVIDLARALLKHEPFSKIQRILKDLKDENPESVRHVIRAYMTNVILGSNKQQQIVNTAAILSAFSEPFPSGDGISPVVLACCGVYYG